MIRPRRVAAIEPRRVVVELSPEDYDAIDTAIGWVPVATYLRIAALKLVREVELPPLPS